MKAKLVTLAALLLSLTAANGQEKATVPTPAMLDLESGLAIAPGFPVVKAYCTACHSAKLVTQADKTRDEWVESIRWMQRTQGLFPLGDAEGEILDYLAGQYGIKAQVGGMLKLPPLANNLMPPMPAKQLSKP